MKTETNQAVLANPTHTTNTELWSRVNLEMGVWVIIGLTALGLRLWNLAHYPLTNSEAVHSLTAFNLYYGQQPTGQLYSPLLVALNTLTFLLFGASEISARLGPALVGALLVFVPGLLVRQLGRRTSLLAAALLAISPSAIFLSRTLNSELAAALGGTVLFAGLINWLDDNRPRWLSLAGGGLAIMLSAGPLAWSIVVIFAALVAAHWRNLKARPVWQQEAPPQNLWRQPALVFGIGLAVLATAAGFNLSGLSRVTALPGDWLGQFGWHNPGSFNAFFLLTVYEPLPLLFGLAGLGIVITRPRLIGTMLAGWVVAALLLDAVMGGRAAGNVILPLIPLTLLAAVAMNQLWNAVQQQGRWDNEGILLGAGLVIGVFVFISLTGWLLRTCPADDAFCRYGWLQAVAAGLLFVVIVAFFAYLTDMGVAVRGMAVTAVALGLLFTLNLGWRLNYGPLPRLAFQPLAGIRAPASGLVTLTDTITDLSIKQVDSRNLLDVTLAGVDAPALAWRLRDFANLAQTESVQGAAPTSIIITPDNVTTVSQQVPYLGQHFTLESSWSPVGLSAKDFISWFIYRHLNTISPGNRVIMWLRIDE